MLTTKECEAVVPGTKPIKLFDGLGLYLHVTTGGHKGWRWKYRFGGKERGLVFGSFPEISLKRARDMRDDARALLRQGVDPGDERRRAALRRIAGVDANSTFQVVAERWHTMQAPQWKERHASDVITSLTNEVFPYLGGRPLGEIKPVDVRAVLDRVQMRGAVETAHRLRQRISAVFRYAIASDIAETDPAAFVGAALQPVRKRKQPAFRELDAARAFLMAYEAVPGHPTTKLASRLLALTAARPGMIQWAEPHEFEDLDGPNPIWRVPAEKMKLRKEHAESEAFEFILPLSAGSGHGEGGAPVRGQPAVSVPFGAARASAHHGECAERGVSPRRGLRGEARSPRLAFDVLHDHERAGHRAESPRRPGYHRPDAGMCPRTRSSRPTIAPRTCPGAGNWPRNGRI
jgi:hypothetical protein